MGGIHTLGVSTGFIDGVTGFIDGVTIGKPPPALALSAPTTTAQRVTETLNSFVTLILSLLCLEVACSCKGMKVPLSDPLSHGGAYPYMNSSHSDWTSRSCFLGRFHGALAFPLGLSSTFCPSAGELSPL